MVEDAVSTERRDVGVVVPRPKLPLFNITNAEVDVVAVPATVVVEKYKFPPAFLNVHCERPEPAESESCGRVAEYPVIGYTLVVVPNPVKALK